MSETNLYQQNGVVVTDKRFIVNEITYPISQITSVKMNTIKEPKNWNKVYLVMALLLGFFPCFAIIGVVVATVNGRINDASPAALFPLLCITFLAFAAFTASKPQKGLFVVNMSVSSGEVDAYSSTDRNEIASIVGAINKAIVGGNSANYIEQQTPTNSSEKAPLSLQTELQKLADMREKGLIDDEEYKTLKKKLIDKA